MNPYKSLIIVESPAKCKKIETYLGKELYKCVASYGHIRELDIKRGVSCINKKDNYEPSFKIMARQSKRINDLKKDINMYKEVILATDDDREGEAIAWHICQVFNLSVKTTKRIIFHEITKTALQKAVNNPTYINMNTVQSQKARQVLDLLVGFTVSPMLWKQISSHNKSSLSAGRCQTPALRLVYDNETDIINSPGKQCYDIRGNFIIHMEMEVDIKGQNRENEKTNVNKVYTREIEYKLDTTIDTKEEVINFLEKSVNHKHNIYNSNETTLFKKCPEPLTTSRLQQKASNIINFSPKTTMATAQKLYEAGYITYMRTDSKLYSQEFINSSIKYICDTYDERYIRKDMYTISLDTNTINKNKKGDSTISTPHEAIRPTNINIKEINMKETPNSKTSLGHYENKLYKLIWNTTLESCMDNAELLKYTSYITSPIERQYHRVFEKVIFKGWLVVQNGDNNDNDNDFIESDNINYDSIKCIDNKKDINYKNIKADFSLKNLKQHYTEAKLISLLEKKGIGRPSTFSSLITKIIERGYVSVKDVNGKKITGTDYELLKCEIIERTHDKICGAENKKLILQPIGKIVIEFLIRDYDEIFNYEYTDNMEKELDQIEKGGCEWFKICEKCDNSLSKINDLVNNKSNKVEFSIDENHTYKIGRYGGYIERTIVPGCKKTKKEKLKIKPGIELDDIKLLVSNISETNTKINIDNIIQVKLNPLLGLYNNKEVLLKKGKYGLYITYDGKNTSIKDVNKDDINIKLSDVIPFIERTNSDNPISITNKNIIRVFTSICSLRKGKGKSGNYVFYKNDDMKKPKFINIKKYKGNIEMDDSKIVMEWIEKNI